MMLQLAVVGAVVGAAAGAVVTALRVLPSNACSRCHRQPERKSLKRTQKGGATLTHLGWAYVLLGVPVARART